MLPSKVSRGDELTAAWANKVVDALASLRPMAGEGTRVSQTPGGFIVSSNIPFEKKTLLPFDIILSVSDAGGNQLRLVPGTVSGFLPSNILTPLTVDLKSTVYVSLDVTSSGGGVVGVVVSASGNAFSGQVPTAGIPASSFSIPAGVILEGIPYNLLAKNWVSAVPVVAFITYSGPANTPTPSYIWSW